eukprot:TRINITY_DN2865_c0_g1_i1.p1 TRINITY_DN2865_c0_g1~~TRINITY_DN2865_c0_g1_i1.p1  ORF type:complete len:424 (+),score=37.39 TRINITY_DN2865_c0_g1_i1:326-1597(+)
MERGGMPRALALVISVRTAGAAAAAGARVFICGEQHIFRVHPGKGGFGLAMSGKIGMKRAASTDSRPGKKPKTEQSRAAEVPFGDPEAVKADLRCCIVEEAKGVSVRATWERLKQLKPSLYGKYDWADCRKEVRELLEEVVNEDDEPSNSNSSDSSSDSSSSDGVKDDDDEVKDDDASEVYDDAAALIKEADRVKSLSAAHLGEYNKLYKEHCKGVLMGKMIAKLVTAGLKPTKGQDDRRRRLALHLLDEKMKKLSDPATTQERAIAEEEELLGLADLDGQMDVAEEIPPAAPAVPKMGRVQPLETHQRSYLSNISFKPHLKLVTLGEAIDKGWVVKAKVFGQYARSQTALACIPCRRVFPVTVGLGNIKYHFTKTAEHADAIKALQKEKEQKEHCCQPGHRRRQRLRQRERRQCGPRHPGVR